MRVRAEYTKGLMSDGRTFTDIEAAIDWLSCKHNASMQLWVDGTAMDQAEIVYRIERSTGELLRQWPYRVVAA